MKKILLILLMFAAFQYAVLAQSPNKVLKKAAKALGGEKVLRQISSRQFTGTITRNSDNASGKYESETFNPNLYRENYDLNGIEFTTGFNGKSAWRRDSKNGLETLTGASGRDFQAESNYRNALWFNAKRDKSKIAYAGQSKINEKSVDAIVLTTAKNSKIKVYFDSITGLPVRTEFPNGANGDGTKIFDYDDYKIVDGVNEPFSIVASMNGEKYFVKISQVTHNKPVAKTAFDFPKISNEPLPDIASLLKQVEANQKNVDGIKENYTYTQTETPRAFDKSGSLRDLDAQTFQVSFYKGLEVKRLIAKNGKPLNADEIARQDRKAQNRIEDIDKKVDKKEERKVKQQSNGAPSDEDDSNISVSEILSASNLVNPRREKFRTRDVIVFDFEPNPSFDYKNAKSFLKFFGKTAGAIWIDESDRQVARIEAFLVDNLNIGGGILAKLNKGGAFTLEQNRIGDEIWLPSAIDVNLSVRVLLVKGITVNQNVKFSDYQKFKSEVKAGQVDETKKP
ncbi:MAG: hypothetical protein H7Z37_08985 [Pyrinomonadaceae bacterium]|nr:hypothetical protein [Pyrinomonadaceae bacterium]